ncbi:CbiQ family ECF transporter T component [Ramlibacter sp. MAHUQ-53]|uniref:CbiQ family ECF transporter T component n=1 Tax=unclassified Ramlibacter TaxID=2617605 RepID=UPI00363CB929
MVSLYSDQRTWLHRVPAGVKLAVIAGVGTGLFMTGRLGPLLAVTAACVAVFASLGAAGLRARRLVVAVLVAGLLVIAFQALMGQWVLGVASALRLLGAALLGAAYTLTTRYDESLHVLECLLSPLRRVGVRTGDIALQFALMLRWTEQFFVVWSRLDEAHRLRTGRPGGVRILGPLVIHMLTAARRVADTLQVRLGK